MKDNRGTPGIGRGDGRSTRFDKKGLVIMDRKPVALISVFNKKGIVAFAAALIALGWDIISSGGTAKVLRTADIPVMDVSEITGFEPMLDHRVATRDVRIHGGLLALEQHLEEIERLATRAVNPIKIPWIDLVCCDMYPLVDAIAKPGATLASIIASHSSRFFSP